MVLTDLLARARGDRARGDRDGDRRHAPGAPPDRSADWAAKATAQIETVVELLRDKSVRPLLFAARLAVLAIAAGAVAVVLAIAGTAGVVRLLDNLVFSGHVWATDAMVGGILTVAGVFLMRQVSKEGHDVRP